MIISKNDDLLAKILNITWVKWFLMEKEKKIEKLLTSKDT